MKKIMLIVGCLLILLASYQGGRYIFDYNILSEYGKGFIWGNIIILLTGISLVYLGIKKKRK